MKVNTNTWIITLCLHTVVIATTIKETIGKNGGCVNALGMESSRIADTQISASSFMIAPPSAARLNKNGHPLLGAWCASYSDLHPFLQIDLLNVKNITAVSSQGAEFTGDHWVSSYNVSYSCDGRAWQALSLGSTVKIFSANNDTDSVVRNSFPRAIVARMIRIHPVTWYHWGSICMRVELHGCKSDQVCLPTSPPTTPPSITTTTTTTTITTATTTTVTGPSMTEQTQKPSSPLSSTTTVSSTQATTTTIKTNAPCIGALGMENYQIKDHQITASSAKSVWTSPSAARLNNRLKFSSFGSWCASRTNSKQYLQVDFQTHTTIVAIATQGMAFPEGNWVTNYAVSYSCDGIKWFMYAKNGRRKIFSGNTNSNQIVKHNLATPLTTRIVRLNPVTWNAFGNICVRMELYGCSTSEACTQGNISEPIHPATTGRPRRLRTTVHVPHILHDPVRYTKPTIHSPKPTSTRQPTKKKKRIVIIYKKIEDEETNSSSKTVIIDWIVVLFLTSITIIVFR